MEGVANKSNVSMAKHSAEERGRTELGWLQSRHTFSFGDYFDPDRMGFRSLRVINDDIVEPGQSFGIHSHRDAEIISYVIEGELEHKDSMGNGSIIEAGNLQYMSTGSGVRHREFNPSKTRRVHFLQVWLIPDSAGGEPRYAGRKLGTAVKDNALTLLLSGQPQSDAIEIRLGANVYFGRLEPGHSLNVDIGKDRFAWVHVIEGELQALHEPLRDGDGAGISNAQRIELSANHPAQFLLFDLP